ncbi:MULTISPECIES: helix-turn-helix transcriptional regulator [Rhodococcus]|uniref:Helix-turn-helix domain-containing protein n=1 Tax=Rhodococcus koreensis TaxID=99653 RepID=A0A1H5F5C6_9NOCA|nr:helix-turn-helix transcriptional regulator [Rhodococcus koreensis]SED98434.1 Helix-turn-helix domain-containing protein [Rhodococcus koreensis]
MGRDDRAESYFRKRIKAERMARRWSQEDLAKRLAERGLTAHPTTIAKIEAGTRAIKLDEAAELAALFDISLDALLGRGDVEDDLKHATKTLADTAMNAHAVLVKTTESIVEAYELLRQQLDFTGMEKGIIEGRQFDISGLSLEHIRALMIWTSQDLLRDALYKASMSLSTVAWAHYATPIQVRDGWDGIMQRVEQLRRENPEDPLRLRRRMVFVQQNPDEASETEGEP